MTDRKRILVLCTGNRCRSQMAEGWLRHFAGDRADVRSAGTQPKGVHPLSIRFMAEAGVDMADHTSDHVDTYKDEHFDVVVTVCNAAREACPTFANADRLVHQPFDDPDAAEDHEREAVFRRVRDEIRDWAQAFVTNACG